MEIFGKTIKVTMVFDEEMSHAALFPINNTHDNWLQLTEIDCKR
jgi:hypothetical protein